MVIFSEFVCLAFGYWQRNAKENKFTSLAAHVSEIYDQFRLESLRVVPTYREGNNSCDGSKSAAIQGSKMQIPTKVYLTDFKITSSRKTSPMDIECA